MPSSNGKDRDGLSISISDHEYLEVHRAKYDQPGKATASIVVREIRAIGLNVLADPDDDDPRHALIKGMPDLTLGDEQKAQAERFAELLAKQATQYRFPV